MITLWLFFFSRPLFSAHSSSHVSSFGEFTNVVTFRVVVRGVGGGMLRFASSDVHPFWKIVTVCMSDNHPDPSRDNDNAQYNNSLLLAR